MENFKIRDLMIPLYPKKAAKRLHAFSADTDDLAVCDDPTCDESTAICPDYTAMCKPSCVTNDTQEGSKYVSPDEPEDEPEALAKLKQDIAKLQTANAVI